MPANQGYLLEFICTESGCNTYYECGYQEYKTILHSTPHNEVKDRTDCPISWQEYGEQVHSFQLQSAL